MTESSDPLSFSFAAEWGSLTAGLDAGVTVEAAPVEDAPVDATAAAATRSAAAATAVSDATVSADARGRAATATVSATTVSESVFDFAPVAAALSAAAAAAPADATVTAAETAAVAVTAAAESAYLSPIGIGALAAADPSFGSLYGFPRLLALVVPDYPTAPVPYLAAARHVVYVPAHGVVAAGGAEAVAATAAAAVAAAAAANGDSGAEAYLVSRPQQASHHLYTPLGSSARLAAALERLFMLCPEARGDLAPQQRQQVRCDWFDRLANTPAQKKENKAWAQREVAPLEELRTHNKVPGLSRQLAKKLAMVSALNAAAALNALAAARQAGAPKSSV
jgi:hypothetical protein